MRRMMFFDVIALALLWATSGDVGMTVWLAAIVALLWLTEAFERGLC